MEKSANNKVVLAVVAIAVVCFLVGYTAKASTSGKAESVSFDAFDKDGDGTMSRAEFNAFLKEASWQNSGASNKKAATGGQRAHGGEGGCAHGGEGGCAHGGEGGCAHGGEGGCAHGGEGGCAHGGKGGRSGGKCEHMQAAQADAPVAESSAEEAQSAAN